MIPTSLFDAQGSAINLVNSAYQQAITAPVSFTTAAGVAKTYQADPVSQANLQGALIGFTPSGATPSGFYWRSLRRALNLGNQGVGCLDGIFS